MLRESVVYILSRGVPSGIAFVTGMLLTWLLAPAEYGAYGLGLAVIVLISAVFFDWHALSFMRFYQSNAESPTFMPTILQSFLLLCGASIVLSGIAYASGLLPADYRALLWICVPGCWCYAWFELSARMEVARFRPAHYFWMNLARNTAILVVCSALAWMTQSALFVLGGSFLAMLGAALIYRRHGFSIDPGRFDRRTAMQLWVFGWPVAIVQILAACSFAADRFLLDTLASKASVGFYTVAYALTRTTISTIGAGIDSAIYSRAVKVADTNDREALRQQLSRSCTLLLAVLLPATVGIAMVAPALARLCVAPEYVEPVSGLIAWMAVGAFVLNFRANYVDHGFHFGKTTIRLTMVMGAMTIANLAADLILIPRYGALGAAQAGIVSGVIGLVYGVLAARSLVVLPFPLAEIGKIAGASLAMAAFLWPFRGATQLVMAHYERPWSIVLGVGILLLQVGGGAAVFGICALGLNVMNLRKVAATRLAALMAR